LLILQPNKCTIRPQVGARMGAHIRFQQFMVDIYGRYRSTAQSLTRHYPPHPTPLKHQWRSLWRHSMDARNGSADNRWETI